MAEARTAILVECMNAGGFNVSAAEVVGGDVPPRFDGEAFLLRLYGDLSRSGDPIPFDTAVSIASDVEHGKYTTNYSCVSIADAIAPIRALGVERAESLAAPGLNETDAMATLLADPTYIDADRAWRACLDVRGVDSTPYKLMDDLTSDVDSLSSFTATTDPAARSTDAYRAAVARLPVLQQAIDRCNPPFEAVIKARVAALFAS